MITLSDQHFALGNPHEMKVEIPRPMRRAIGLAQYSTYELLAELWRRAVSRLKSIFPH